VDFRVLGPFEVAGDDSHDDVELGGPQQRTVLALLVVRANEIVSTDAIVEAIWADRPPASAVGIVRTYLSRLRHALSSAGAGAHLVGRAPGYLLELDPEEVDANRFERLTRQGQREMDAGNPEAASATLTAALGLWRGAFLADLADRPCFGPVAARFEDLRFSALEDRIDADLARGRHADLAGELEELTARHPFRERLWGQRIVALYRSGRQADALAAYRAVHSTLVEQLGIAPGPALQRLELDVLRQAQELGWSPPSDAPPPLAEGPESRALIGRAVELSRLDRSLRAAREGTFRAVFVAGPPGIGKTALVTRWARLAGHAGAEVAHGRADEDVPIPFQALQGALRRWATSPDAPGRSVLAAADVALLSRLVPEVGADQPATGSTADASPDDLDVDRRLLFEVIRRWIACLAGPRPAVLVLEDLHWADHATVLALRQLLRHPPAASVLLVVTYRDTELAGAPELARLIADTRGEDLVAHIQLVGLRGHEVIELLRAEIAPEALDEAGLAFAVRLHRRTGGNPLFIHETLRHLTERGALVQGSHGWPDDRDLDALGVPDGVSQVVGRRLRNLPERTARVLREASVLGPRFDVPALSRMLAVTEVEILEALEPAVAAALAGQVGAEAGEADDFAFSHSVVRDAIYATVPLGERPQAHWRAGQALADLHAAHLEPHVEDIARHLIAGVHAGDASTAIAAGIRAGRRAMAALAFEDAVEWFQTVTALVARTGPNGTVDPDLAFRAWFGLGTAALATGRWADQQYDGYLHAARIARAEDWPERLARSVIGLTFHSLGAQEAPAVGASDDGATEVERLGAAALEVLDDTAPERAFLLGMATTLAVRWGRGDDAHQLAGLAAEVARSVDDPTALGGAHLARCWTLLGGSHPWEMVDTAEHALALPLGSEVRAVLHTLVLPCLVIAPLQLGDRAGYEASRARLAAHPEVRRSAHLAGYLRMLDATIALASGRVDDAERAAASIAGKDEWWIWHDAAAILSNAIAAAHGQFDDVISGVGTSLALIPDAAIPRAVLAAIEARGQRARMAARHVEELGRRVRQQLIDQPFNWDAPVLMALAGEVAARLDATSLADDLLPVVSGYAGQMLVPYLGTTIVGAADRPLGQALLALGRHEEARERFAAARDLERSFGADGLATESTYWLARAHLADGQPRAASVLVAEASADAERMGLRAVLDDCRALSRTIP